MERGGPTLCWWLAALTMVVAGLSCGPGGPSARHVVLIVMDTVRADHLSVYGYDRDTTPYLETLAGESVLYRRAKAPAPWTIPSHASLFTGLWPAEHKAQWGRIRFDDRHLTLAEMLAAGGFWTVGLSSNDLVDRPFGMAQGFDLFRHVDVEPPLQTREILRSLPAILNRASRDRRRLFLFLNLMDAHIPYNAAPWGAAFGVQDPLAVGAHGLKWSINAGVTPYGSYLREQQTAGYDAALRWLDDAVRAIVEMLDRRDLLDDTLLVVTSDHGEGLGGHPEIGHSISVWEEQLAVPLIVRYPGGRRGGVVVERLTSLVALAPTLLDETGVPRPPALEGRPALDGVPAGEVSADYRSYFSELKRKRNIGMAQRFPQLAARVRHTHVLYCGTHKYSIDAGGKVRLFDLAADAVELRDLSTEGPPALAACQETYRALARAGRYTPFDEVVTPEDEQAAGEVLDEKKLRALGYLD